MKTTRFLALVPLILVTACVSGSPKKPAAAPQAPVHATATGRAAVPADDLLLATLWTQRAVEHNLVFREIYRNAMEKLPEAIADPTWNAMPKDERERVAPGLPPAVILDIDEAILDNSPYEARLIRSGQEYNDFTWSKWCDEEAARPLPGALQFTRYAAAHGVAIFYISNRAKDLDEATLANLRKDGFPVASPQSFLGLGTFVAGCEQYGSNKGCRRRLLARAHRVVMQFGDQLGDFVDVISNTPEGRAKSIAPYLDWIGERWWVLPNPMYGSWLPAQFNNAWQLPRAERRKAEIDALRAN